MVHHPKGRLNKEACFFVKPKGTNNRPVPQNEEQGEITCSYKSNYITLAIISAMQPMTKRIIPAFM